MIKTSLRTLPALMLVAFSGVASASAFQLWEQNASGLGVAYAGSAAVADNASTIYYNPAGMSQLTGAQVSFGVNAVRPVIRYDGPGLQGGDAGSWGAVPNGYLSWQLTPSLTAGVGVSAPFALSTEYDANWVGAARAIKSEVRTLNVNPSVAYKLNDKVAFGFGLNYQTIDGELTRTGVRMVGDNASWGWNAGALFTLSEAMRVGVSYRSAVDHTLRGKLNGAPVKADLELPGTFILSVWQQVSDRWEAMGDLSWTNWKTVDRLAIVNRNTGALVGTEVFDYDNAWRVAWGAAYKSNEQLKLKFGVAFDRTPTGNADRSPRVPDGDRLWFSAGAQWKTRGLGTVDLGYAFLHVKDTKVAQPPVVGKYDNKAHVLGLQYSIGF